jgi:hypothetical protein
LKNQSSLSGVRLDFGCQVAPLTRIPLAGAGEEEHAAEVIARRRRISISGVLLVAWSPVWSCSNEELGSGSKRTFPKFNHQFAMNKTIEVRSLLCGVVVGAIAVLCLGAALKHNNQIGRFLLETGQAQTAFIIDTVTGQVWQKDSHKDFFAPKAEASSSEPLKVER